MKYLVLAAVLIGVVLGALWLAAIRRAFIAAAKQIGEPTPAEAKIETETAKTAGELAAKGDARAQEVDRANQQELLALARKRWFPGVRK